MEIGFGIRIMWPLAAQEAAAGGATEIEPGHMLCAALKLAELPSSAFQDVMPNKELIFGLEADQTGLCAVLESLGIRVPADSKPLRRGLRGLLRKRDRKGQEIRGGVFHRSASSKALFARAQAAAQEAGEKEISSGRLVEMVLSAPDYALAEALAKMGNIRLDAGPAKDKAAIAWIEAWGCDLTGRAREEKADTARVEAIRRDALCRVLAEALFAATGVKTLPSLLVSRGERHVSAVMNDLALWLVSSDPPKGVNHGCILEIHSANIINREADGLPEGRLEEIFQHAATHKSVVLFFNDFHRYLTPAIAGEAIPRRFQTLLREGKTNCVMGMTQKQYETYVEHVDAWRNMFKIIWIHDTRPNFQL
jgi:ATP-dependent Clp protease ATP-binding subunit ClpA